MLFILVYFPDEICNYFSQTPKHSFLGNWVEYHEFYTFILYNIFNTV